MSILKKFVTESGFPKETLADDRHISAKHCMNSASQRPHFGSNEDTKIYQVRPGRAG